MTPWLYALWFRLADGGQFGRRVVWRSAVPGADLFALVIPNPRHPLLRPLVRPWLEQRPGGFIENVVSVSLVALVVILFARWRKAGRFPSLWVGITVGFAILALGPFLTIGGVNTHIPLPWFFLGHLPLLGAASTPARFAAVMRLGMTVLFGLALEGLADRVGTRGRLLVGAVAVALVAELLPVPRTLYAADMPDVYAVIAADQRPVSVLHLPHRRRRHVRPLPHDGPAQPGSASRAGAHHHSRTGRDDGSQPAWSLILQADMP